MSSRLELLMSAAERLPVELVAQTPICVAPGVDSPVAAYELAQREGFDILPVRNEGGRIVRFVRTTTLEGRTRWDDALFVGIEPDDIVSSSSPLLSLLDRFSPERPLLFVLGRDHIDAIVTAYDLNQPAAHQFGFALCLVVEAEIARAVEDDVRMSPDQLDSEVDAEIAKKARKLGKAYRGVESRVSEWERDSRKAEQVRLMTYLRFHDKIGLVELLNLQAELAGRCRVPYCEAPDRFITLLRDVKKLRNAVAHNLDELIDYWAVWRLMRTTYHLAHDLTASSAAPAPE